TKKNIEANKEAMFPYEPIIAVDEGKLYYKNENGGMSAFLGEGYVEPTIDSLTKATRYKVGDVVSLQGYYEAGDGAHHLRKIATEDDGSGNQLANGLWANIVHGCEVNVSWFGAKGDGVTDDSDCIQKAIKNYNYINFGENRTYLVNHIDQLVIKDRGVLFHVDKDKVIKGENSTLLCDMGDVISRWRCIFYQSDGHLKIEGLSLVLKQYYYISDLVVIDNISNTNSTTFENCKFIDGYSGLRLFNNVKKLVVDRCEFKTTFSEMKDGGYGIFHDSGLGAGEYYITNSNFEGSISSNSDGIEIDYGDCEGIPTLKDVVKYILIENNTIKNYGEIRTEDLTAGLGIGISACNTAILRNNFITNCREGIHFETTLRSKYNIGCKDVIIDGNTLREGVNYKNILSIMSVGGEINENTICSYIIKNNNFGKTEITLKNKIDLFAFKNNNCDNLFLDNYLNYVEIQNSSMKLLTISNNVLLSRGLVGLAKKIKIINCSLEKAVLDYINPLDSQNVMFVNCVFDNYGHVYDKNNAPIQQFIGILEFKNCINDKGFIDGIYRGETFVGTSVQSTTVDKHNTNLSTNFYKKGEIIFSGSAITHIEEGGELYLNPQEQADNQYTVTTAEGDWLVLSKNINEYKANRIYCLTSDTSTEIMITEYNHNKVKLNKIVPVGSILSLKVCKTKVWTVDTVQKSLDTPYYTEKMKQANVYQDFTSYMDSQHEYDKEQKALETAKQEAYQLALESNSELKYEEWLSSYVELLPVLQEPTPSEALQAFYNEYK
ncbi:MAG: hypothetical protein ACRC5T_07700, partial [Cetobacterium sp.]